MDEVLSTGFVRLIPALRRYALQLTGSRTNAEDLLQDTLVRMWRYRGSYEGSLQLKTWIMKIMRNEFLRQKAKRLLPIQYIPGDLEDLGAGEPDQERRLISAQSLHALDDLTPGNREAVLLTAYGFSCDEVSRFLGCSAGTVKSRVSRARQLMRRGTSVNGPPRRAPLPAARRRQPMTSRRQPS